MSIKRYDLVGETDGNCNLNEARMESSDDGCYVKFRDYSELQSQLTALTIQLESVVAENAARKSEVPLGAIENGRAFADRLEAYSFECQGGNLSMCSDWQELIRCFEHLAEWAMHGQDETPATDAVLAEVRAQAHKEGAHFVANRMLAAWDAGFIDDTAKNAADIARMILTSTEFMADAPDGDFDRSFADGVLEDIAAQLRQGGAV
ncbi:Eae-like protein [Lelliottia amnigena]|uniref:Eae-like protein n=1 Tax=Lelliottia amnigena TaxID=61646 RepID=UPI001F0D1663|nr:Eae-like protein [Lelliottia amnigena]